MSVRGRVPCILVASFLTWAAPFSALAAGHTARAGLSQALTSAKAWHADAILVHLSSAKVRMDGTASEWRYSFYSPGTAKRCVVTSREGGTTTKEVRLGNYTEPLGDFVDSDKAMEVARQNGLKGREPSMSVVRPAGARGGATSWLVTGGFDKGDTAITIDAKMGAFSRLSVVGVD